MVLSVDISISNFKKKCTAKAMTISGILSCPFLHLSSAFYLLFFACYPMQLIDRVNIERYFLFAIDCNIFFLKIL